MQPMMYPRTSSRTGRLLADSAQNLEMMDDVKPTVFAHYDIALLQGIRRVPRMCYCLRRCKGGHKFDHVMQGDGENATGYWRRLAPTSFHGARQRGRQVTVGTSAFHAHLSSGVKREDRSNRT
eukprot:2525465-Amphidinium_carterae.1